MDDYDSPEGFKRSKINAGASQAKRIADAQERINFVSLNPLGVSEQFGVYNYEIWLTSIDTLLQEIDAKLSKDEREFCEKIKDAIYDFKEKHPVFKQTIKIGYSKGSSSSFDRLSWKTLEKAIAGYEKLIRRLLDEHDFNSPADEEETLR